MIDQMKLARNDFINRFGGIYEHSAWVAEAVHGQPGIDTVDGLHAAMRAVVDGSDQGARLALLRAHPELACAPAQVSELSAESASEQSGAGLDRCTPAEYAEFQQLNAAYRRKFGFPFIIAVRGLNRQAILDAFRARIEHSRELEFETALAQVHRIAGLRLQALIEQDTQ